MKKFEEDTLKLTQNRFKEYSQKLSNIGLALDIQLTWYERGSDENIYFSRIEYSSTYMCNLGLVVRKEDEPKYDLHLKCICYITPISQGGIYLWRPGIKLTKIPTNYLNEFLEQAEKEICRVFNEGYETVLQEIIAQKV